MFFRTSSLAGTACYLRAWIQDYWVDRSYRGDKDLTGTTAVVTGGTVGGLGFAAAELLYELGATVVVTVRTAEKGRAAVEGLQGKACDTETESRASYVLCDFLSEDSVRACAAELRTKCGGGGIDFLVLNAGISGGGTGGSPQAKPEAERDADAARVWMTNHVGPFVFANELMPLLVQAARKDPARHSPRAVWVSSGAHKRASIDWEDPFHPSFAASGMRVYAQSKLANILHAREYQKRVRECLNEGSKKEGGPDVRCFALTPGAVWTGILGATNRPLLYPLLWATMRTPRTGAQVIKMACLDEGLEGGEYLSNCYAKDTEGKNGCSNDEAQWKKLWELTEGQVAAKAYADPSFFGAREKSE